MYIDDIIVYTSDAESHLKALKWTFGKIREAGLQVSREKSVFLRKECEILGFVVNERGIEVSRKRLDAILKADLPKTISELRSFIGMLQYIRRFIPSLSLYLSPLTAQLKGKSKVKSDKKLNWDNAQRESFLVIQKLLKEDQLVNAHFDPSKPLELFTDASLDGIAGLLTQDGNLIYVASKTMKPEEKRYSTIEREALAAAWSMSRLREFVIGRHVSIFTDHKPLIGVLSSEIFPSERLARICNQLIDYQFEVNYIKGEENPADFLSRNTLDEIYL